MPLSMPIIKRSQSDGNLVPARRVLVLWFLCAASCCFLAWNASPVAAVDPTFAEESFMRSAQRSMKIW